MCLHGKAKHQRPPKASSAAPPTIVFTHPCKCWLSTQQHLVQWRNSVWRAGSLHHYSVHVPTALSSCGGHCCPGLCSETTTRFLLKWFCRGCESKNDTICYLNCCCCPPPVLFQPLLHRSIHLCSPPGGGCYTMYTNVLRYCTFWQEASVIILF